ncbi:hypothetical protein [Defluviimonas salinarum]|nr:hypothetical protein [Defluviimonas salinarum]
MAVLVALRRNASNRFLALLAGLVTLALGLIPVSAAIVVFNCGPSSLLRPLKATMCDPKFSAFDVFLLSGFATMFLGGIFFLIMLLAEALRRRKVKS